MMLPALRNPGSYRDQRGYVFHQGDVILRSVSHSAKLDYEYLRDRNIILESINEGFLIETEEVVDHSTIDVLSDAAYVLRHKKIPFISYPYEWSFGQLKSAALHHLRFQLFLLDRDVILRDASAYNIQFIGATPIFIDLLSLAPYKEGDYWIGHRQFCEQFLNPLLLRSTKGLSHNHWYRGSLEGIPTAALARLLTFSEKLTWNNFSQVSLQAWLETKAINNPTRETERAKTRRPLSKTAYRAFLGQFFRWILKLKPKGNVNTVWGNYTNESIYLREEESAKRNLVLEAVTSNRPKQVIDLGCNVGNYSIAALEAGASYVVGLDSDISAIEHAFDLSRKKKLQFLPLYVDAANPSPALGWMQSERQGIAGRCKGDMVIALAFIHHLVVSHNIPLDQVLRWITDMAPSGLIEFVPKNDAMVTKLLELRDDEFPDYTQDNFTNSLSVHARIIRRTQLFPSGRIVYEYSR